MDITPYRSNTGSFQPWKSSRIHEILGAPQIPLDTYLYLSKLNSLHSTPSLPSWRAKSQVCSIALGSSSSVNTAECARGVVRVEENVYLNSTATEFGLITSLFFAETASLPI